MLFQLILPRPLEKEGGACIMYTHFACGFFPDNSIILAGLKAMLVMEGFEVETAENGAEAIKLLEK